MVIGPSDDNGPAGDGGEGADDRPASLGAGATPPEPGRARLFLVVVDDTEEWRAALRFACRRAVHTQGRIALLRVVEPGEFQHWMAVEDMMREEQRQEAEQLLQRVAKEVNAQTGSMPVLYLRDGDPREQLQALIDEEPAISILVLAAAPSEKGPGPLISDLMTKRVGRMRIPVTIVPGGLADGDIDEIA
ncbi:MAG: universal stress protein [Azospirillaceae bacterium]